MAHLVFASGERSGQKVEIPVEGITIGRAEDTDLPLQDPVASGHHADLKQAGADWRLTDLDSSNGTTVNGDTITQVTLADGDQIVIGNTTLVFGLDRQTHATVAGKAATQATDEDVALVRQMSERTTRIRDEVGKVIVGQVDVLNQILMCMIAGGHGLLVGLPGMAKTLMVSTIARVLDLRFKRVQFTPDLMPADITGTEILESDRETGEKIFRFIRGPLFCNLLLADEINRTPPKTQAALLEAMQEKKVTAGNETYDLEAPFFVLATQNPIEQEGTYPLPEAQLDRFMFNIWVDYPEAHEEEAIVTATTSGHDAEPQRVLTQDEVLHLQHAVRKIPVSPHVIKYVIRLVRATRPGIEEAPEITKAYVSTGAGPRAGQFLVLAAKARAVIEGRIHVSCGDVRAAAIPVLRHRILTNFAADSEGMTSMDIVKGLLDTVQQPGEDDYR